MDSRSVKLTKSYQVNYTLAIGLSGKLMLTLQDMSFNILMVVNFSVDNQDDGFVLSKNKSISRAGFATNTLKIPIRRTNKLNNNIRP
jgi:hypothetical protein